MILEDEDTLKRKAETFKNNKLKQKEVIEGREQLKFMHLNSSNYGDLNLPINEQLVGIKEGHPKGFSILENVFPRFSHDKRKESSPLKKEAHLLVKNLKGEIVVPTAGVLVHCSPRFNPNSLPPRNFIPPLHFYYLKRKQSSRLLNGIDSLKTAGLNQTD